MAHVLRITDNTTTVQFATSGNMYIADYTPQTATDLASPMKETARIGFTSSISTIQSNLHTLDQLFYQAGNYDRNRSGKRVYVEFDPGSSGTTYRSLLYSGISHPPEGMLGGDWAAANLEFDLEWTRRPYWEGPLTQIPLTNGSSTGSTALTIGNCDDGSHDNWASIASTDVLGDLPAPIKIQMVNGSTSLGGDEIFVYHNVHSAPSTFGHILEGEAITSTLGSTTSSTACSNGGYETIAWTSAVLTKLGYWGLSTAEVSAAAGGRFALLARWAELFPYKDLWIRFQLEATGNNAPISQGNLTLVSGVTDGDELVVLDTLRLPPSLWGLTTLQGINLTMYAQRGTTDNTIKLDYLQLSPISGDAGWLRFKSAAGGIPGGDAFIHDATEGYNYHVDGSNNFIGDLAQYGGPLLLFPNFNQKLYFLTSDYTGVSDIEQTWTVKLWYRPRRTSI